MRGAICLACGSSVDGMVFTSIEFIFVFLPICYFGFLLLRCARAGGGILLLWLNVLFPTAKTTDIETLPQNAVRIRCPRTVGEASNVRQIGETILMTGTDCRLWLSGRDQAALQTEIRSAQ